VQAVDLRGPRYCHPKSVEMRDAVRTKIEMNTADRRMDLDIRAVLAMYRNDELPIGEIDYEGGAPI